MNKKEKLETLEEIKEDSKVLEFVAITMQEKENLQSNWNSLKEDIQRKKDILDKDQALRFNHETKFKLDILNYVLDKMNELEGKDNNENN